TSTATTSTATTNNSTTGRHGSNERVREHLLHRRSFLRIRHQHRPQEVQQARREPGRRGVAPDHLERHLRVPRRLEVVRAVRHRVLPQRRRGHRKPGRPQVRARPVGPRAQSLGTHEAHSPVHSAPALVLAVVDGAPEVHQTRAPRSQQDVRGLHVPVDEATLVQVPEGLEHVAADSRQPHLWDRRARRRRRRRRIPRLWRLSGRVC
ncbi:unnamed protein product, partial [Ectocarpus sp. 6 AP-2014]